MISMSTIIICASGLLTATGIYLLGWIRGFHDAQNFDDVNFR